MTLLLHKSEFFFIIERHDFVIFFFKVKYL